MNNRMPQQWCQPVKMWCEANGINEQSYYRWQRRLFEMAQDQSKSEFAEITPEQPDCLSADRPAVTVHIAGVEAKIYNGADTETVQAVLKVLMSC